MKNRTRGADMIFYRVAAVSGSDTAPLTTWMEDDVPAKAIEKALADFYGVAVKKG